MHLLLLGLTVVAAIAIRLLPIPAGLSRQQEWMRAWGALALPPLLPIASSLAVVLMGPSGQMHGHMQASPCLSTVSHLISLGILAMAGLTLCQRVFRGWQSIQLLKSYPVCQVDRYTCRVLPDNFPFAARLGFWDSELLISQGLLSQLSSEHLAAVLSHEQSHHYFRDTFWFFWLGWLRQLGGWLPNSHKLWQQLLLLRELRADALAATECDRLVLAEALFQVVSAPFESRELVAAFGGTVEEDSELNRLEVRIDALLDEEESFDLRGDRSWYWVLCGILPLAIVPLCHC